LKYVQRTRVGLVMKKPPAEYFHNQPRTLRQGYHRADAGSVEIGDVRDFTDVPHTGHRRFLNEPISVEVSQVLH